MNGGCIAKRLRAEGIHGPGMDAEINTMLNKGYETGAVHEKMRAIYGD